MPGDEKYAQGKGGAGGTGGLASLVDVITRERVSYARTSFARGCIVDIARTRNHATDKGQHNSGSLSDSRVLTISSDLPTVLQVLNEVVPNLEEVSANSPVPVRPSRIVCTRHLCATSRLPFNLARSGSRRSILPAADRGSSV